MKAESKLVIDCSFTVPIFLDDESGKHTEEVFQKIFDGSLIPAVPLLWYFEVCNVILISVRRNRIEQENVHRIMKLISELPTVPVNFSISEYYGIMDTAKEFELSFYDASYLFIARSEKIPIATYDKKLQKACMRAGVKILA